MWWLYSFCEDWSWITIRAYDSCSVKICSCRAKRKWFNFWLYKWKRGKFIQCYFNSRWISNYQCWSSIRRSRINCDWFLLDLHDPETKGWKNKHDSYCDSSSWKEKNRQSSSFRRKLLWLIFSFNNFPLSTSQSLLKIRKAGNILHHNLFLRITRSLLRRWPHDWLYFRKRSASYLFLQQPFEGWTCSSNNYFLEIFSREKDGNKDVLFCESKWWRHKSVIHTWKATNEKENSKSNNHILTPRKGKNQHRNPIRIRIKSQLNRKPPRADSSAS